MLLAFWFPLKRKRKERRIKGWEKRKRKRKQKRLCVNSDLQPTDLQVPSEDLSAAQLTWPRQRFPRPKMIYGTCPPEDWKEEPAPASFFK